MKIADVISERSIVRLKARDKEEVLKELCRRLAAENIGADYEEIYEAIRQRENIMSTGIGLGLAVPHVRLESVTRLAMSVAVLEEPIDFGSLDDKPVNIVVMIVSPAGSHKEYLKMLASVVLLMKNERTRERLLHAATVEEIYQIFKGY